jgi:hypothetical protein
MNLKLKLQLIKRNNKSYHFIFLDIKKAYDSVGRERTIKLLQKYGVGEKMCKLINNIWQHDTLVPKQSHYYGKPFKAYRGVRQGDIVSPTIFNIIMDAIIRNCEQKLKEISDEDIMLQFYADDGLIGGENGLVIQQTINIMEKSGAAFGLNINTKKTEAMIVKGAKIICNISKEAYDRRINGIGKTYREKENDTIICDICNKK